MEKERGMNREFEDLMSQAVEPEIHRKILLRAAELVVMGWTRGSAARNEHAERVQGTNPTAISWCLSGAVYRALFEIGGIDGYQDRGAGIIQSVNFWWRLMRPLYRVLEKRGWPDHVLAWNDYLCGGQSEAEAVLREAAASLSVLKDRQADKQLENGA
jgi:hypothetical protein